MPNYTPKAGLGKIFADGMNAADRVTQLVAERNILYAQLVTVATKLYAARGMSLKAAREQAELEAQSLVSFGTTEGQHGTDDQR